MSRPNVLVIQADQLTALVLPMYGGAAHATPHMNRLAERGVTFLNAYCNNPVCAPSRAAMLAGRLSSAVGAFDNAADFPSSTLTLAHYLRRATSAIVFSIRRGELAAAHALLDTLRDRHLNPQQQATKQLVRKALAWRLRSGQAAA